MVKKTKTETFEIKFNFNSLLTLVHCDLIQVRLFQLSMDKQIIEKHLSHAVMYVAGQIVVYPQDYS